MVVIVGGAIQGCEMAEFLVKRGRKVVVTDSGTELGDGMGLAQKQWLFKWLSEKGVEMLHSVTYEEITDMGLVIRTKEGERRILEADSIVTALPLRPNTELIKQMEQTVPEIYSIGDCHEPGLIKDAIADGARVGRTL